MQKDLTLIEGLVRDHFVIEGKLFSTPLADAHKAIDRYTHSAVLLWLVKFPVGIGSLEAKVFSERLQRMQMSPSRTVAVLSFGVDSAGTGFAAIPPLNGFPLYAEPIDRVEGERRFAACVDLVSHLHQEGVVCGDITPQSFWVGRSGQISFIGVVGMLEGWFDKMDPSVAHAAERFVAPEMKEGLPPSSIADVFSLGVLGYLLLTNAYPIDEESEARGVHAVRPLQRVIDNPPAWGDKILLKALEYDESLRFASAVDLREAIREAKNESFLSSITPIKYGSDVLSAERSLERPDSVLITGPIMRPGASSSKENTSTSDKDLEQPKRSLIIGVLAGLVLAITGILVWILFLKAPVEVVTVEPGNAVKNAGGAAQNVQVRQAIAMIGGSEADNSADEKYFDDLAVSADPLVNEVLVRSAVEPRSNSARALAEKAIIKRSERLGFVRSSKELKAWLDGLPTGIPPASYEIMLKVVDPTLPLPAHIQLLRSLLSVDLKEALTMAMAIALDSGDLQAYLPLFQEMIKTARGKDVDSSLSMRGLALTIADTSVKFSGEILGKISEYEIGEIFSLLGVLVELRDPRSKLLTDEIARRQILTPPRDFFLSAIDLQGDMPAASLTALIHAAAGRFQGEDLRGLGSWFSKDSEKVLLCLDADLADPALRQSVFDVIAGRSIVSEPAASLVKWIREKNWDARGSFAGMIGVLGCADKLPQDRMKEVYAAVDAHITDENFVSILIEMGPSGLLEYIFLHHPSHVPVNQAFNLLLHEKKEIRIAAMKLLKGINDLTAMKLVIDRYENEKDPDVRKAYKDTFWFIKQRQ